MPSGNENSFEAAFTQRLTFHQKWGREKSESDWEAENVQLISLAKNLWLSYAIGESEESGEQQTPPVELNKLVVEPSDEWVSTPG